jgi:heme/copper-type cytochrome/quinol oxidase subunit 4
MNVSLMVWILTCAVILGLFVFDFFAHVRVPHDPTFRESATWSSVYIALAVVFGLFVWWQHRLHRQRLRADGSSAAVLPDRRIA